MNLLNIIPEKICGIQIDVWASLVIIAGLVLLRTTGHPPLEHQPEYYRSLRLMRKARKNTPKKKIYLN